MRIVTLMNECLGMRLLACKATRGTLVRYTGVRADGVPPRGPYTIDETPLYDLDMGYSEAWRWLSNPSFATVTNHQRLLLLLGETVKAGDWTIEPL